MTTIDENVLGFTPTPRITIRWQDLNSHGQYEALRVVRQAKGITLDAWGDMSIEEQEKVWQLAERQFPADIDIDLSEVKE